MIAMRKSAYSIPANSRPWSLSLTICLLPLYPLRITIDHSEAKELQADSERFGQAKTALCADIDRRFGGEGANRGVGFSGPQIEELLLDTDLPEDVVASHQTTFAPNHWGGSASKGRWFIPADEPPGHEPQRVVVLGYQFWQRYYAGDPDVVGRPISLVRKPYRIIGILPPRFRWREADIYVPQKYTLDPNGDYFVTLKIRSGYTIAQANAPWQPVFEQFAKQFPSRYPEAFRVNLRSIVDL